jgi:ATP-dependent metalloprotease
MSALQASLFLRPLPTPNPPRRRMPVPSASVHFPRAPSTHRRAPPCLRALAPDAPEPPAAAVGSAAEPEPPATETSVPAEKGELEDLVEKGKAWVLAVAAAVVASARRFVNWVMSGDWMSWWPFWRPHRRLQRLIDEADANPKDAAKQSALLHELNKTRCAALLSELGKCDFDSLIMCQSSIHVGGLGGLGDLFT